MGWSARTRRLAALVLLLALGPLAATQAHAFGIDDVARRAKALAASPFKKPDNNLPKPLQALGYDEHRDIRFRPEQALWRGAGLPFEIMFFHQGWLYEHPVKIHEVGAAGVREIAFDPAAFTYGKNSIDRAQLRGLGFAGFRVHFPLNTPRYRDETLVFLGASYLRAVGRGQQYGLSARGLAIDTAASTGEQFPRFVEFWIERPAPGARELTIHALLDSPSATGAYRFVLKPGITTALEVDARLFLREKVGKLGLAPLTSMFFFGANQPAPRNDYRPQVHDSDGLSIRTAGGEWLWRPLVNPKKLLVTSFALTDPRGFGLMQRERWFGHYEDLESRYDLRPSAWVEPKGNWGPGKVELVQIPVPDETNDNIVAHWVPDRPPDPGAAYEYGYRVLWQKEREMRPPLGWVAQTRRGRGYVKSPDDSIEFHVDFVGSPLGTLPSDTQVEGDLWINGNGKILEHHVTANPVTRGRRLTVRVRRTEAGKPLEVRAHLRTGQRILSETWSYILPPE